MRTNVSGWVLLALLTGCPVSTPTPVPGNKTVIPTGAGRVHSQGTALVDGDGKALQLRCANIDGWLMPIGYLVSDAGNALRISPSEFVARLDVAVGAARANTFWKRWRETFITEKDFERMAQLGFNCARLPLYHRAITRLEAGALVLDPERLAFVDQALAWGLKHGVYVVLDLHSAPGGQNGLPTVSDVPTTDPVARLWEGAEATANQDATVALWRSLAQRYREAPAVAGYDLLNEPKLPATVAPSALPAFQSRIVLAIREVDTTHLVIVEGDDLAHDFKAFSAPAMDSNLAYSFHAYALTGFEDWAKVDASDLQPYLDLRTAHERPLWLGEFGEGTKDWISSVVDLMETNQVGWALYPWKRKQTFFWNPVPQLIKDSPKWYVLARYMAQAQGDNLAPPSAEDAEAGMAEILSAIELANCTEDRGLTGAIIKP